jgi:peptidoglycan/LPS O-acetylase OafA/YrhL
METALPAPRIRYEPALDGLRAIAVLAVVGYHGDVAWLRGGFLGVDVFFVLSGYLITALLLAEHAETGRVSVRAFYVRRARRLLPALFLLLLGTAAFSAFVAYAGDRGAIRADAFASLLYVQNWHLVWARSSYFISFAAPSPLRHLWSLAIEEQFYVVWPLTLLALLRVAKGRRGYLVAALTTAIAVSAGLMAALYHSGSDPSRAYYGTDTRAHELLVGALLAVLVARGSLASLVRQSPAAGWIAAAVLAGFLVFAADTDGWLYRGGFLAIAVVTAVVVASVTGGHDSLLSRVLRWAPLRATGRISYGLYLWHWPVMLWLTPDRTDLHGNVLLGLRVAVTYAIATASFVLIERPVRTGIKPMWRGRRFMVAAATCLAFVIGVVSVTVPATTTSLVVGALPNGATLPPLPGPTSPPTTPKQRALLGLDAAKRPELWAPGDLKIQPDGFPLAPGPEFLPGLDQRDGRPHIVMVGDSVLYTLTIHFDPGPTSRADYYQYPQIGCGFLPGLVKDRGRPVPTVSSCPLSRTRWRMLVDRRRPDLSFLFVGGLEVLDHVIDGRRYRVGTAGYHDLLRDALLRDVDLFSSKGGLVVMPTVPCYDPKDYGIAGAPVSRRSDRTDPKRVAAVNAVIGEVARSRPDVVRVVDLAAFLCPGGKARDRINGVNIRSDGVHFSPAGAQVMSRWLAPRLEAVIPAGPVFATKVS